MLPGFRILLALVVLSFAILMFGFSALALFRTAHQNLASQPTWQPSWRTPVEIANAQRDDRQQRASEMQTLALLRVELPSPQPLSETANAATGPGPAPLAAQQQSGDATPASVSADVTSPQPTETTAANSDGRAAPAASPDPVAAVDKASEQATTLPAVDDAPKPTSSNASAALEAPQAVNPSGQPAAFEPITTDPKTIATSANASEPPKTEPPAPKPESPTILAALPDATASSEAMPQPQAGSEGVKKPDAAELRARRRARARLHARRLALARARAARLAQAQQATTNSPFYGSNFPITQNATNPQNATPNATPFNPPRGAP
jgi:hypothetical protein